MDATQGPDATPENDRSKNASVAAASTPSGAKAPHIESPSLVPEQGESVDADSTGATPPEASRAAATALVLAPIAADARAGTAEEAATKRVWRLPAISSLAATIALALGVGAIAGTLATLGLQHLGLGNTSDDTLSLQQAITRLNGDVAALKTGMETSTKAASGQFVRLTERLDRAERTQSEPAAKLAKISEAVDRLEKRSQIAAVPPQTVPAAPSPAATARAGASTDTTGSISPAAKDLSRLPIIPGWALHSVYGDTALVSTRIGLLEIEVGDPLPGGGRVEAIRRDHGRWVVVTSRGLIVAR